MARSGVQPATVVLAAEHRQAAQLSVQQCMAALHLEKAVRTTSGNDMVTQAIRQVSHASVEVGLALSTLEMLFSASSTLPVLTAWAAFWARLTPDCLGPASCTQGTQYHSSQAVSAHACSLQ